MFARRVQQNAAKAIVWLTVVMFALPAMPSTACGCATDALATNCECCARQGLKQSCNCSVQESTDCCSENGSTKNSCCKNSSLAAPFDECSCDSSCSCKSGQQPMHPLDPLAPEEDSSSKIDGADSPNSLSMPVVFPTLLPLVVRNSRHFKCQSSLECCISLSRFTL